MKLNKKLAIAFLAETMSIVLAVSVPFTEDVSNSKNTEEIENTQSAQITVDTAQGVTAGIAGVIQDYEMLLSVEKAPTDVVSLANTDEYDFDPDTACEGVESDDWDDEFTWEDLLGLDDEEDWSEDDTEEFDNTDDSDSSEDTEAIDDLEDLVVDNGEDLDPDAMRPVEEDALTAEEAEWQNYLMPDVNNALNVRAEPNKDSELVGKLYRNDCAVIVEIGPEWTEIVSGELHGFVKNKYCLFGADALAFAQENCKKVATSKTDVLRIRKEPSTDSTIVANMDKGEFLSVAKDAQTVEGWVAVKYNSEVCYVSEKYVTVSYKTGTGVTMEQERAARAAEIAAQKEAARIEAEKKAAEKKAAQQNSSKSSTKKKKSLAKSVDDLTLLAALVQCEADSQCYDCMLGVASVVMNRVASKHYPDNIYDVIFDKGQFGPAATGKLERRLAKTIDEECFKAAKEAMEGTDNTNGAIGFKLTSSGKKGVVYGPVVFFK